MDSKLFVSKQLKNHQTITWLKSRFRNQVKDKYVLNDQELKEQIMMKAVFNSIDRDNSKFLDRQELYDMFISQGIKITKNELKGFFKKIDEDDDDKLNWNDFKQALTNTEALLMFAELMKKIRANQKGENGKYIPSSFPNMIQYMNYCVLRQELIDSINSVEQNAAFKVKQCKNLLSLEELCYRNMLKFAVPEQSDDELNKQGRRTDHQQQVIMRRQQEKERASFRLSRIKNYSSSQSNNRGTDSDATATERNIHQSLQIKQKLEQSMEETGIKYGRIIDQLTKDKSSDNQIQYNYYKQSIGSLQYSQQMDTPEQDYSYRKEVQRVKQPSSEQKPVVRGSHFTNQYFLHIRQPSTLRDNLKFPSPRKQRFASQVESIKKQWSMPQQ